ncbi:MAG: hypothetical protein Q4C12_03345 [Clostridia bacterium]|nr:hypothetical protein [Clostridia bacterium]
MIDIFAIGALGYSALEVIWRGFTHPSMGITGGICFTLIYMANAQLAESPIYLRALCGCGIILLVELIVGILVNIVFKWNVWDYSAIKFNLWGQICLRYAAIWFLLCFPVIRLCDYILRSR